MEKASPSPSRSGRHRSKARVAPSTERQRLDNDVVGACHGESFNGSTASFIDMDPAELLFSMRWTSGDAGFGSDLPLPAGAAAGDLFPREPSGVARDDDTDVSPASSSPAFHSARSTPVAASASGSSRSRRSSSSSGAKQRTTAPLLATGRLLLRYLLPFLAPLCRKARSLAPRSGGMVLAATTTTTTPARRSASSAAAEHWCHGNADDTAVRDAILYCKKSFTPRRDE